MPQIKRALRDPLKSLLIAAQEVGEICYIYTANHIIPIWQAKPGWTTASKIRRMFVQDPDMRMLRHWVQGAPFDDKELLNQAAMAYDEFYRRVVSNYEDFKAKQNTDVYSGVQFGKAYARSLEDK